MSRATRKWLVTALAVLGLLAITAGSAMAGEVKGNGGLISAGANKWGTGLHARSECAYSGQEDLQYFEDDENTVPKDEPTRGMPGHAQSWGQISQEDRAFLTSIGLHPSQAYNPIHAGAH